MYIIIEYHLYFTYLYIHNATKSTLPLSNRDHLTHRWASVAPPGSVAYRLPAYKDESRKMQFRFLYLASNLLISNPLSQVSVCDYNIYIYICICICIFALPSTPLYINMP